MSPLSNSVYSSVFTYNPNVLTRRYQHLTTKASIEPHHITCVTLDISVLIVRPSTRVQSRYPYEPSKNKLDTFQQKFLGYLTNCLITMHQMMDYPYQRVQQLINKSWNWFLRQVMMQYSWYTKLTPVIILMHVTAHSAESIKLVLCKINTN